MTATDRPFLSSAHIKPLLESKLQPSTGMLVGWREREETEEKKKKEGFMVACKFVHRSFGSYQLHLLFLAQQ